MRIEEIGLATLINADCRDAMRAMDGNSIDAVVCDPPYGLNFMGKGWDHGVPGKEFWVEALRVAKPGAHLLAFGGTRTFHRLMAAIEDAGWEIRDTIMWVYGSGFPKSLDVSKAIDKAAGVEREVVGTKLGLPGYSLTDGAAGGVAMEGNVDGSLRNGAAECAITAPATEAAKQWEGWGTALKPAWEPVIVARKPLVGTVAANVQQYGTGALNIDGCRVEGRERTEYGLATAQRNQGATYGKPSASADFDSSKGRWPANLIHDGSDEVLALFPDSNGSGGSLPNVKITGYGDGAVGTGKSEYLGGPRTKVNAGSGSAARFFKECNFDEAELLFCRAESIIEAWTLDLANTADLYSPLSESHVASVLNDVVTLVSRGARALSDAPEPSIAVTPTELKRISTALTTAMLSIEERLSPGRLLDAPIPNGCHVNVVETPVQTDTMTITISHWKSDGSADAATFSITPLNSALGAKGSASRFKYCAKTSKKDRNEGLDDPGVQFKHGDTLRKIENKAGAGNHHPTVKPTDLMRYLCRLVTPPSGTVLDPFMGSGSTGKAALLEGFSFVGIDDDEEHGYFDIAMARIKAATMV